MKLIVIQCSSKDCTNTFDHPETFTEEQVLAQAIENGWTKRADGKWSGCSTPESCPCIKQPKEPT